MVKMTIAELSAPGLGAVLGKLSQAPLNDVKKIYRFKKLADSYNKAMNVVREEYKTLVVKVFGEFDEKGNVLPDQKPWGFKLKDESQQAEFDKANDEFHKREISMERDPLALNELTGVTLSAADLNNLGKLLVDPEDNQAAMDNISQIRR